MEPGLVSVMMPAYNAGRYIREAIESVLDQSYRDWELLIVNDGSTDDTGTIAAAIADPRVRVLHKANGGESSARNLALDHSRGEFIGFLDADDVFRPQHLELTVGFLRAHPDVDAVYTDGFHMDTTGRRLASLQSRRRGPFEGRLYEEIVRASDVFGPPMCVVLRHEPVARHRLRYDERIVIGPDWDFFRQFAEIATFGYLPHQTGFYRVHETNITAQVDATRRSEYLAICRENAIGSPSFATCSVGTREAVFYDLLINLLRGHTARRDAVVAAPAFGALPRASQARLLRFMAADAILHEADRSAIDVWLRHAAALNPSDHRTTLLGFLYRASPWMCRQALAGRSRLRGGAAVPAAPFADLRRPGEGSA